MTPKELAKNIARKADEKIIGWAKENPKLVVAVDGYTGVGKSTLLKNLIELNPDILEVSRDDFVVSREETKKALVNAEDKSKFWELESGKNSDLEKLIQAFKEGKGSFTAKTFNPKSGELDITKTFDLTKKILVIEGVFLFHPELLNHLWDKRIYLEGNLDEIDRRRIAREKEKWGADYFPETHPDSYIKHIIVALKRYIATHKPAEKADYILMVD